MRAGWTWGWQFDGACRGEDSSLFFAPSYFEKRRKAAREVRQAICTGCPVRTPLDYALRPRVEHWGGLNGTSGVNARHRASRRARHAPTRFATIPRSG
jgi:WhiB family redox-sensing transcriptional regulator